MKLGTLKVCIFVIGGENVLNEKMCLKNHREKIHEEVKPEEEEKIKPKCEKKNACSYIKCNTWVISPRAENDS